MKTAKPYQITLTRKSKHGLAFTANSLWKGRRMLRIAPVVVLTGNNGSGKTAMLKAIAAGAGVDPSRASKSDSQKDRFWTSRPESEFGFILNSHHPDQVWLHSPTDQMKGRGYVEDIGDLTRLFASRCSHGEMLYRLIGKQLTESLTFLKENSVKKCAMLIIDEPEAALSLETLMDACTFLGSATRDIMNVVKNGKQPRIAMFIATQNPELCRAMVSNGAERIDLGGWKKGDPFEPFLKNISQQALPR